MWVTINVVHNTKLMEKKTRQEVKVNNTKLSKILMLQGFFLFVCLSLFIYGVCVYFVPIFITKFGNIIDAVFCLPSLKISTLIKFLNTIMKRFGQIAYIYILLCIYCIFIFIPLIYT